MSVCVILAIVTIFMTELGTASVSEKQSSHQKYQELAEQTIDLHKTLTQVLSETFDFETTVNVATSVLPMVQSFVPNFNVDNMTDMLSEYLDNYLPKEDKLSFLLPWIGDKSRNLGEQEASRTFGRLTKRGVKSEGVEDWESEMLLYSVLITVVVVLVTPLTSFIYWVVSGLVWVMIQVVLVMAIQQGLLYYFGPEEPVLLPVVRQVYSFINEEWGIH